MDTQINTNSNEFSRCLLNAKHISSISAGREGAHSGTGNATFRESHQFCADRIGPVARSPALARVCMMSHPNTHPPTTSSGQCLPR